MMRTDFVWWIVAFSDQNLALLINETASYFVNEDNNTLGEGGMLMIDKIIQNFVKNRVGGVIVIDSEGELIYEDSRIILSEKGTRSFLKRRPPIDEEAKTWEFTDAQTGKYYRVETSTVSSEGKHFQCHLFTDVSDYAGLFQDISNYSRQIADISNFQSNIMSKLTQPYETCIVDLAAFCESSKAVLYVEQEDKTVLRISYRRNYKREVLPASEDTDVMLYAKRFDMIDGYYCFLSDNLGGQRCSLYLMRTGNFNEDYFRDVSVYNVIRLYIENGLLREKIIYDSEHDALTGLYNKGKYLSLKKDEFGHPEHISIFNMDVNNLKKVNDNLGHEEGDRLLMRAARSIHAVTSDEIMGFRLGGDEFMIIATNCDEARGMDIRDKWNQALKEINEADEGECIIACGFIHGEKDYDLDELLARSDKIMYENKKAIKAGEEAV